MHNTRAEQREERVFELPSLRDLGELEVIQLMERSFGTNRKTVVGFGDDVSAIKLFDNRIAVLKTDMLVGSTDVPPGMTMRQAARKAVIANVSDLAAKGIQPLAGLVALGLPRSLTKQDIQAIAAGLGGAAREYRFPIVGGDTNESKDLTISIALFAIARRRMLVLRSGARVGDIVAVTGEFGAASAGLKALLKHRLRPNSLAPALSRAVYRPRAELDLGLALAASSALTASIDSSDGLAWSLHQLSQASNIGIEINHVPVSKSARDFAARYHYKAKDLALYGGEEYHLVVTVKPNRFNLARRVAHGRLWPIGVVSPKRNGVRLKETGGYSEIPMRGWEHFKR
jgi:thiamine-monophosphate kinase